MEIVKNKISNQFIDLLKKECLNIFPHVKNNRKDIKINYVNLFHKNWEKKKNNRKFLKYIKDEIGCVTNLISYGFINAPPNCNPQKFHLDYSGYTCTYFIPLVEINNKNGTEYIHFYDKNMNIECKNILFDISDKYLCKSEIIDELAKFNLIYKKDYEFRYLNTNAFSIAYMPNFIFHRGRTNETKINRIMFQVVFGIHKNVSITDKKHIHNSNLDETEWCKKNLHQTWCKKKFTKKNKIKKHNKTKINKLFRF
uniref:Phytanoyl-CoA dioxygenase n=1 Tax=viral metagenome TaxID=1070528 RepID=A0A6C0BBF0_9ZZZZ